MDERDVAFRRELWRDADVGLAELVAATLVLFGAGWLGDRWLATSPWLAVVGTVLGFALGTYLVYLRAGQQAPPDEADTDRP